MLSDLLNVPRSALDWQVFGNSHAIEHQNILQAIRGLGGPNLQQYQLYPIYPERIEDFLERNQHAHTDINSVLNLTSTDLQEVDVNDESQLAAWVNLHHNEHYAINQRLGI